MALKIYNSLTHKKEEFVPIKKGRVGMYVCGPTVYDQPHIGHARSAYIFDVIVRYLRYKKLKVTFVRNVTDIDDKIIDRARQERGDEELKEKAKKIAKEYLGRYHQDMDALGLARPDIEPKATEVIKDIINFIEDLIKKEYAYEASGNVYFDIRRFKDYGQLSGQSMDQMAEGARLSLDRNKRDPLDFALWKASKEDEPSWNSPWGKGRPGWHIECSVMSTKFLKEDFLIHGGGLDLIFPHHENEIAQTVCAGKKCARYWIHNGLLTIDSQKMSKSLGNFVSIKEILHKYHAEALKLFFLSAHYRSPINFTYNTMRNLTHARETFYNLFDKIDKKKKAKAPLACGKGRISQQVKKPEEYKRLFISAMDDDFKMQVAMGYLYMMASNLNSRIDNDRWDRDMLEDSGRILLELGGIFGLFKDKGEFVKRKDLLIEDIKIRDYCSLSKRDLSLVAKREEARKKGDFKAADEIRKNFFDKGIIIEDTKEGPECRRKT